MSLCPDRAATNHIKQILSGRFDMPRTALIVAALLTLLASFAGAADYPARPVTMVLGFAPGGPSDVVARLVARKLEQVIGQPVVVENRPGAGGTTGTAAVASAAPDGHTLLVCVNAPVTMNVYMQKNFPFDPRPDCPCTLT